MNRQYKIFLIVLTFVNLIQATFTELLPDEAYYYMYSTRLSFGYFDHPPMIAVLIKIGEYLTHSQLGVRLICVLLNTGTAILLFKICNPKNVILFIVLYLNFIAFQAIGFLAVPDIPLMFFAACFFYSYKKFTSDNSWSNAILLSLFAAALIYSKYHGFLLIGFVVLSNLKLLREIKFYAAVVIAIVLLLPHILWQIKNEFPSIKYHLGYRFDGGVNLENIFGYLGGQLAFIGPIAVWCLIKSNFNIRHTNLFIRAAIFTALGFLLFFLASSFNGRIEANWTAAAFIPFIIIAANSETNLNFKLVKIGALGVVILMLPLRIYLMYDFLPAKLNYQYKRHGWQQWANNVKHKANGAILVFQDSYQKTAMYSFYTQDFAHSINSFGCRKSQYDLWNDYELRIQGKDALVIPNWVNDYFDSIPTPVDEKMCCILNQIYRSYTKMFFHTEKEKYEIKENEELKIKIAITAPDYVHSTIDINKNLIAHLSYRVIYLNKDSFSDHISETLIKPYLTKQKDYKTYLFNETNFKKGSYNIIFYGRVGTTESGMCKPIEVEVK